MKPLKNFNEYIKKGVVKKQSSDKSRAKSLMEDSKTDYDFLVKLSNKIGIEDEGANTIIKGSYDILMGLIRAKLLLQGFKSHGQGAHEAEVSYLRELGFKETEIQFADNLRWSRNGILYYGKKFDKNYAEKVLEFLNKTYPKLKKLLEENIAL